MSAKKKVAVPDDLLGEDYDPLVFWPSIGPVYEDSYDPAGYISQEVAFGNAITGLPWNTVLDCGCGFGRLGELIQRVRPGARYTGFDISPHQIAAAKRRLPDAELYVDSLAGFNPQGHVWDLVISAEVLMHQPAEHIEETVRRIFSWSRGYVVTCDWYEPGEPGNVWNVPHNYPALYGENLSSVTPLDRQAVFVATGGHIRAPSPITEVTT